MSDKEKLNYPPNDEHGLVCRSGGRLAIQKCDHIENWYLSYSPRNNNGYAEGTWEEWVELARNILQKNDELFESSKQEEKEKKMSDNVWNYDMSQCPCITPVLVMHKGDNLPEVRVFSSVGDKTLGNPIKWVLFTPPSEPEVWIKHDNDSFPNCHPLDRVKIKTEDGEQGRDKDAIDWNWVSELSPILEYCIVEKHKKC